MKPSEKYVGLDTSFVLRLLVGEPEKLFGRALAALDRLRATGQRGAVSDLVVAEAYFALHYHYGVPKQLALDQLSEFLESPEIVCLGEARTVLQVSDLGKAKPGFVDRLIHAEYLRRTEGMLSFEKASKRLPGVNLP